MKNEKFGTIMNDGKMVNLDSSKLEDLEKISEELKTKEVVLKEKMVTVLKQ